MALEVLLIIISLLVGGAVVFFVFKQSSKKNNEAEQTFQTLNQRMDSIHNSMNQALRDTVKMVSDQLKDSRESTERSSKMINEQVRGFTSGLTQLNEGLKQVHSSVKDVSSFQDIFKAPKLRGIWGESSLEATLSQYFPKDAYQMQYYFKSGEAVDAILRLPNKLILPIDSKFNWENFEKMVNADNDLNREMHKKTFFSDVKRKVEEIATKYIIPSEGTTDFALMYIPAETVYYEIINNIKDADIPAYARAKKVFLTSPNTFGLSVSAIMHWLKDIQLSRQTKDIMKRLERIAADGRKLGDDFRRLGKHLSDARGSYEDSEKRLGLMIDRVENVIELEEPKGKSLEESGKNKANLLK